MLKNLGLACALAAGIFVPVGLSINAAHASDEVFAPTAAMALPAGPTGCNYPPPYISPAPCKPLQSFDISYVDEATHTYLLADRSNAAIDVFDTLTNSFVKFLQPTDPFAGAQPASVVTGSGPNGVILVSGIIKNPPPGCGAGCVPGSNGKTVHMVWAGDAPTPGGTGTSHLKVMDLVSGTTIVELNTLGVRRADELCFVTLPSGAPDPANPYVMIANDNVLDNYVTIWRWDNFAFVEKISLAGNDPLAAPFNTATSGKGANGIEQCKFNPRNKSFYLAVPATQGSPILTFGAITGGSGYTAGTYNNVALTDVTGTGVGAIANITVGAAAGGGIASLNTLVGGSGYTGNTTYNNVPLTGGTGTLATANITVTSGIVATLGAFTAGSGYSDNSYPNTPLTGGTGTGATANITVVGGVVTVASLAAGGSGYTAGDTLSASFGGGSGFSVPVATIAGKVTAVTLVKSGSGYTAGDILSASNANLGGAGSGFSIKAAVLGGPVTAVTLVNGGFAYAVGDSLSASAASIGGTGSGFSVLVATVNSALTTDGHVLQISLPKMPSPWIPLTKCKPSPTNCEYAKVVAAYDISPGGTGCGVAGKGAGPAGLSIGPSFNGTNTNGLIALGCGAGGTGSLIIDDSANTILSVPFTNSTDETWYDPATNHFFFAQSGTSPAFGSLGVVNANEYPPRSYVQEDEAVGGPPVQDTTAVAATGSHSVAVFPGTCNLPSTTPTRPSRVYVPTRSTLTAGAPSTICSGFLGGFPATGAAPLWPGGTVQAPTATTWDEFGCIAVFTAPATCTSTGHANPSP